MGLLYSARKRLRSSVSGTVLLLMAVCALLVLWHTKLQWASMVDDKRASLLECYDHVHLEKPTTNKRKTSMFGARQALENASRFSSMLTVTESKQTRLSSHPDENVLLSGQNLVANRSSAVVKIVTHYTPPFASIRDISALMEELDSIIGRIDKCLASTNMLTYFKQAGYYNTAMNNARLLWTSIREVTPKFIGQYHLPCWNSSFLATRRLSRLGPEYQSISGHIGEYKFSYSDAERVHRTMLHNVPWNEHKRSFKSTTLCFPKLFLLGYPKCGSTYLYCLLNTILKLSSHSVSSCQSYKEPHWWVIGGTRKKVTVISPDSVALYLLNFAKGILYIERSLQAMTIDASPNLMFQWPRYRKTETMQNYCLLPAVIPALLPDSKYIVVMRKPVSMLYSAFWYSCTSIGYNLDTIKFIGADIFHDRITKKIAIFNHCIEEGRPLDKCVDTIAYNLYTSELPDCGRTHLEMGFYYVHARKWLSVLPREKILFFTLEDLVQRDVKQFALEVLDFLELDSSVLKSYSKIDVQCKKNNQQVVDYKHDPRLVMRNDTKQLLVDFYHPYNQMLANLLGDEKYLWDKG